MKKMEESRTGYVKRNIFYGYISTIITSIFSIICRTIFVYVLGADYLGVSGLFTNVLGVLSFTELGIGSAVIFALYKPIASDDREKIKSLLALYKKAYRVIAILVTMIGIILIPFLKYLVNTDISISEIRIYYCVFLFNTVSSYFVTYKTSYVTALQKDYIVTNTTTIGIIVTSIAQIILLLLGGDYFEYLLLAAVIGLLQKIMTVIYLNKKFPILSERDALPLDEETKKNIWKNVKALIVHKIGDVSVNQTDNIIISAFISTAMVGVLSNYTTLNTLISTFTNKFFGSFTASFGNMLAKESIEKQRKIFDVYDLLGFWVYGFVLIAFITLSQPFIYLWLGEKLLLDNITMVLYFVSLYLAGMTFIPYNFKVAAGRFNEDKWVAFIQAIVNLVVSILAIKLVGMPGIFIGTIVSRMIVVIVRPYIVFKYVLETGVKKYFIRLFIRTLLALFICIIMWEIKNVIWIEKSIFNFGVLCILTLLIPNVIFYIIYRKNEAFIDILKRIKRR